MHNWRLEKYFGEEEGDVIFKEMKCVKEASSVVLRGKTSKNIEFIAVLHLNQEANASRNVLEIFNLELLAPKFDEKKMILAAYSNKTDGPNIIITLTDRTTGKFVVKEVKTGGILTKIKPSKIFPKMNTLSIMAKNSKNAINYTDVNLQPLTALPVEVKPRADILPVEGSYNLDEMNFISGQVFKTSLSFNNQGYDESIVYRGRIIKQLTSRTGKLVIKDEDIDLEKYEKILKTGTEYLVGVEIDKEDGKNAYGLALIDFEGEQVGKKVVIESFCNFFSASGNENYVMVFLGCHLGADYTIESAIFPIPTGKYKDAKAQVMPSYTTNRVDRLISIAYGATTDKFLVS